MEQKPKLEVTISDYHLEAALQFAVQAYVATQMGSRFEESLTEAIDQAIHARLAEITDKMLTERIEKMLIEGWPVTDRYGNETGRATIGTKARSVLFEKDTYRGNLGEQVLKELLERELKNDLGAALKEATAKLRANIDTTIASKLRSSLDSAFKEL